MKIKLLGDRLLVKVVEKEEIKGGIIVPGSIKEVMTMGIIAAAGPGNVNDQGNLIPMIYKVGEQVLYTRTAGQLTTIEGVEYTLVHSDDIVGVYDEQKPI